VTRLSPRAARSASLFLLGIALLFAGSVRVHAQGTTGSVRGLVTDRDTGEPIVGATAVVSGPSLQGTQTAITDEQGVYRIDNLPPGTYQVTVYYSEAQFTRSDIPVQLGKTAQVNIKIDTEAAAGEVVEIEGRAPLIDQGSTKHGVTIDSTYTENIPTGRTFAGVLGAAAGSAGDAYGISFSGSTSPENVYVVEGINTTDPAFGQVSTNLPNEFVQETEVITSGYNAEYGRATGGIVNVLTKQGSNEFHGSVFGYYEPGFLRATRQRTSVAGSSISGVYDQRHYFDLGAELGGPIVKDRLWFHVGLQPTFSFVNADRIISSLVDEDQDGTADVNELGFTEFQQVSRESFPLQRQRYYFSGKLSGALSPEHQGSLSVFGNPASGEYYGRAADPLMTGLPSTNKLTLDSGAQDISGKWTSKFNNNATQLDAVVGWHRNIENEEPVDPDRPVLTFASDEDLARFMPFEGALPAECQDGGPEDPYPALTNCRVRGYRLGGYGVYENSDTRRLQGMLSLTQRVQALGHHSFKVGMDVENNTYDHAITRTGGITYGHLADGSTLQVDSYYFPELEGEMSCGPEGNLNGRCSFRPGGLATNSTTRNIAGYAQDSWSVLPNLTFNAGLRWEQQTLYVADELQGRIAPDTGMPFPEKAFTLDNMLAPRFGLIFDPTQEGRAKLYGSWGRFYESLPMDINARTYGGEVTRRQQFNRATCADETDPQTCDLSAASRERWLGGGFPEAASNLSGQYLDELVIGGEYELLADLRVGASFIRRTMGRVIEDLSPNGGATFIIANPGEVDVEEVESLRAEAMAAEMAGQPQRAQILNERADLFAGVSRFDKPRREYNGLQLTAERRFTRNFMTRATYTYSVNRGNYPGLFSHETNQLDPNITSMYDLPELMANRFGRLGSDRPHSVKLDGFYQHGFRRSFVTLGGAFRAASGTPINVLARHVDYGAGESYLLPRGAGGRTDMTTSLDLKLAYGHKLSDQVSLEAFLDLFNVLNRQDPLRVDQQYSRNVADPIVGGDWSDLEHAKERNSAVQLARNPNFRNVTLRSEPLYVRTGLRLRF
jgi:outer membrane receptor protein involved in Fe transport